MAYRDYQDLIFKLLRQRIARIKQRRERERTRKLFAELRDSQKVLREFYTDYPYCRQCECRQPIGHKYNEQ